MAWTNGFFNSLSGDRTYNAQQMSDIFKGLITDGVYESVDDKLAVQPNSGMTVQIASGRGWFGGHWVDNSAAYPLTLEASDVTLNRYAAIIVRVDESTAVRSVEPAVKYSALATTPVKPTMERTETIKEYCLAYVYIRAGAIEVTAADIEDTRANTEVCGWVTGLIEQVDTHTLYTQWQAIFNEFMSSSEAEFTAWYEALQDLLDENAEAQLAADILDLQGKTVKATGTFDGLGWNSQEDGTYTQSISVEGVTATNDVLVAPTATYKETYNNMGCECISQDVDTLTFVCTDPEDVSVQVEVIIFNL